MPGAAGTHTLEEAMYVSPLHMGTENRVSCGVNITTGKRGWLLPDYYFEKTRSHLALRTDLRGIRSFDPHHTQPMDPPSHSMPTTVSCTLHNSLARVKA